jgi:MFS family permease
VDAVERLPGIGRVFEESWEIYRRRLVSLFSAAALGIGAAFASVVATALAALLLGLILPLWRVHVGVAGIVIGALAFFWFLSWAQAAAAYLLLSNEKVSGVFDAYRRTAGKVGGFSWICLLYLFVVMGWAWPFFLRGGLALAAMVAAPFVWAYLVVALSPAPFMYLEHGGGGWGVLRRSLDLTRGAWWRIAGLAALSLLTAFVPSLIPFPGGIVLGSVAGFFPFAMMSVVYRELQRSAPSVPSSGGLSDWILALSSAGFALTLYLAWRSIPELEAAFAFFKEQWRSGALGKAPVWGGVR